MPVIYFTGRGAITEKWLARDNGGGGGASHDAPSQSVWIQALGQPNTIHKAGSVASSSLVNGTFLSFQTPHSQTFWKYLWSTPKVLQLLLYDASTRLFQGFFFFYQFFLFTDHLTPVTMSSEAFLSQMPFISLSTVWRDVTTMCLF